jgi:hypothetical protein
MLAAITLALAMCFTAACTLAIHADEEVRGQIRLPTPTPEPSPTSIPDYDDLTLGGALDFPTGTAPSPTFIPHLMRDYRPQAPMTGVAIEGFFDAAGLQEMMALSPRFGRRWREIAWRDVEPSEGQYRWEVLAPLEEELKTAAASNLTVILNIQMKPEWAQKVAGYACGPIKTEKFEAFARFMEQLVQRYGSSSPYRVRYWQIGNEPDIDVYLLPGDSVYGCWGDKDDPYFGGGHYGEMLKVVYPRIKAADPNAQVMAGGLLLECDPYTMTVPDTCKNDERLKSGYFLEGILKAGAGDFFDIMDVHSYGQLSMELPSRMTDTYNWSPAAGGTGLPEKVAFVRRLFEQYGIPDKAIMSTELALKCEEPSDDCEEVGAAYIARAFAEAHGLRLRGAVYFALITEFKYKGLMLPDLTPKKQYAAFKWLGSQLSWVEYVGPVSDYAGISGYEFNRSRLRRLLILWSTDGTEQRFAPPSDFMHAYDKYGNVLPLSDGQVVVGWSPVYVELKLQNEP